MKKRIITCVTICVILIWGLSSCIAKSSSNEGYVGDYYDGYADGYNDAFSEDDVFEAYLEGYNYARGHFEEGVLDDAIDYVREGCEWHPEEAMCIIDAYENGELAFGNMKVTEEDYKEAIKSLYRYYEYFYNSYYDEIMDNVI